jgi:hypothetical protein
LKQYKVLLLTYEGQKPPSPKFHEAMAAWVKAGGALVVVDDDRDPYNRAQDWWNEGGKTSTTPRALLFQALGLDAESEGTHRVGKGVVVFRKASPSALAGVAEGSSVVLELTREAAKEVHLPWRESSALVLRRGPFVIASGFDRPQGTPEDTAARVVNSVVKPLEGGGDGRGGVAVAAQQSAAPTILHGRYIDLFDAGLRVVDGPRIEEGERSLLLDPRYFAKTTARVLAASAKVVDERATADSLQFGVTSIEGRDDQDLTAVRVLLPRAAKGVTVDGKALANVTTDEGGVLLQFPARAAVQHVEVRF